MHPGYFFGLKTADEGNLQNLFVSVGWGIELFFPNPYRTARLVLLGGFARLVMVDGFAKLGVGEYARMVCFWQIR